MEMTRAEKEKVAEQVEGDNNSKSQINSNSEEDEREESYSGPESLVRDWESDHRRTLPPPARELALLAASIHLGEGRGILVSDLKKLGLEKDNAERKLYLSKINGLLVPHDKRIGKQKQYFLANYKYVIDKKEQEKEKYVSSVLSDRDIIVQLLRALSNKKYQYHHIHLETSLNYKDDYDLFKWDIPSSSNKQKIMSFKLEPRRKCSITISATGTVSISIECTLHPYTFHSSYGLVEFFGSCGQIFRLLQEESGNALNIVPSISEWFLIQFDYNKDLKVKDELPTMLSWAPVNGRLKLEYLGTIFQIYSKILPYLEECLRFEGQHSTKEKKKMVDMIEDIVTANDDYDNNHRLPFVTAEEMLKKAKEKTNSEHSQE